MTVALSSSVLERMVTQLLRGKTLQRYTKWPCKHIQNNRKRHNCYSETVKDIMVSRSVGRKEERRKERKKEGRGQVRKWTAIKKINLTTIHLAAVLTMQISNMSRDP